MGDPITDAILAALQGDSGKPGPPADTQVLQGPDGRTHLYQWNPATQRYDIDLGLTGNAPAGTTVNVATTSPASTGSLTIEDIQREVAAAGGKLTNFGGVWRATFPTGEIVDFQPSAKDPKSGLQFYNPGVIVSQKKPGTGISPVDALRNAQQYGAGQGAASTATSGQATAPAAPMQSGDAGTPESNPMLGQDVMGGATGKSYFGTWMPAGGGSSLVSPSSINSSTSTLAAMGFALPKDGQQLVDSEAYASALMQQFGFDVAKAMLKQAQNTGGLTPTEAASPYQPETYAQGGSMTIREPSVIQGLLSGKPYGVMGAGQGERVSNITPLGNERQQRMAGRHEGAIARALAPRPGVLPGEEVSAEGFDGIMQPNGWRHFPSTEANGKTYGQFWRDQSGALVRPDMSQFLDANNNGIDDREEEWTMPDGSKYKRKHRTEPVQSKTPPTPNVFGMGGQVTSSPAMNPMHDPMVLEMMARGVRKRAKKLLPAGYI